MEHRDNILRDIAKRIDTAKRVLLVNPDGGDGDSFGASLAVAHHLFKIGKPYTVFALDADSHAHGFLPHFSEIVRAADRLDPQEYDCIVTFDCADAELVGVPGILDRGPGRVVINVDHHKTNPGYGDVNLVDPTAAAASEIVHSLYETAEWEIDADAATCLLDGIISDTGLFSYRNTTDHTLAVAARLLRSGARFTAIIESAYRNKSLGALRLWGRALSRLHPDPSGIVTTYLTLADFAECDVEETAAEGIANLLNLLGEGRASLVLREQPNSTVKGSFRTMRDDIDVSELAKKYGGGGHRRAAGFVMRGTLDDLRKTWQLA